MTETRTVTETGAVTCAGVVSLVVALASIGCRPVSTSPLHISNSGRGAYEAALASLPGGFVAAWYDTRDGNAEIYLRQLDRDGQPSGPELRLTNDAAESYEPSIDVLADGSIAVAWYEKAPGGVLTSRVGVWSHDGSSRWSTMLPTPSRNPVVRSDGRHVVVAWIQKDSPDGEPESVRLGRWTAEGGMLDAPTRLAATHKTTWNLNMALADDGTAWVVFDAVASTKASELFLVRAGSGAPTVARLSADDGRESKYPDVALRGNRVALTWYDTKDGNTEVYLFTGDATARSGELDDRARRVTRTNGESIGAYVAWNGNRVGLAWSDDTPGQHEVYFQPFDASGSPVTGPRRITDNTSSSLIPAIEPNGDGFALVWNEYVPGAPREGGKSEIAFAIAPER